MMRCVCTPLHLDCTIVIHGILESVISTSLSTISPMRHSQITDWNCKTKKDIKLLQCRRCLHYRIQNEVILFVFQALYSLEHVFVVSIDSIKITKVCFPLSIAHLPLKLISKQGCAFAVIAPRLWNNLPTLYEHQLWLPLNSR